MFDNIHREEPDDIRTLTLLVQVYRFPIASGFGLLLSLLLPFEILMRFSLVVPYYACTAPPEKVLRRVKRHSRLRTRAALVGLWRWLRNEGAFPWEVLMC